MDAFSDFYFDALSEIINIATGRAAQGLSDVIGESVQSYVPIVDLLKCTDVSVESLRLNENKFGVITQEISGLINAELMLLFTEENVLRIVRKVMGAELNIEVVPEFEKEVMCELGNIMMNACVSSIADMLHVPIASGLPHYAIKTKEEIGEYIKNQHLSDFILSSHVDLAIEQHLTEGKLFFLINTITLNNIANEINKVSKMRDTVQN
jgi:chemotaxis protein CheC